MANLFIAYIERKVFYGKLKRMKDNAKIIQKPVLNLKGKIGEIYNLHACACVCNKGETYSR